MPPRLLQTSPPPPLSALTADPAPPGLRAPRSQTPLGSSSESPSRRAPLIALGVPRASPGRVGAE